MSNLTGIFQVATQENTPAKNFSQKPIISSLFRVENEGQAKDILLIMNESHLLVAQVLRGPWSVFFLVKQDEKVPGKPNGLKLEFGKNFLSLYLNDYTCLEMWICQLEKKINQRNFHKLFCPKKKIGKGAFASVYEAERLSDNKTVAVKAFSKENQYAAEKGKESLENQIQIMRNINHNNLIRLDAVFQTENSIYIILEHLPGKQLNDFLRNNKKYTEGQITAIMRDLLRGLRHLAEKNVIHRDLKPQNIMFRNQDGTDLVICDFGLATYADADKYLFVRCGTPGFVAPEIINIKDLSAKSETISDVFSAGLIFHYLLFGESIFLGKKYQQVLNQNRVCEYSFQAQKYSAIGFSSLDLLTKMLEKTPKERISAAQALKHPFFQEKMQIEEEDEHNFPHVFGRDIQYKHFDHIQELQLSQQSECIEVENGTYQEKQQCKTPSVFNEQTCNYNNYNNQNQRVPRCLRKKTSFYVQNQIFRSGSSSSANKENRSPRLRNQKSGGKIKKAPLKKIM